MLRDNIIRSISGSSNIQWRGSWSDGTAYIINDLVENNGNSYISTINHTSTINDEPGVGVNWTLNWDLFASGGADGSDGAPGVDGADGIDGESFTWRGSWSIDTTSYLINDVVYNNRSSYISISDHSPSLDTEPGDGTSWITVWNLMSLGGQDGIDGADGIPGAPGVDGIDGEDGAPGVDGTDGRDGTFTRCDQLILEMEMEFKTSYLCYYKTFTYDSSKQLTDIDIWSDSTANVRLFHKDFLYDSKKNLIQTDLTRISDGALLTSIFNYNSSKQLISIERTGYCSCSSSSSSISISSSSQSISSSSKSSSSSVSSSSSSSWSSSSSSISSSSRSSSSISSSSSSVIFEMVRIIHSGEERITHDGDLRLLY